MTKPLRSVPNPLLKTIQLNSDHQFPWGYIRWGYLTQNSPSHHYKMGKCITVFTPYFNLFIHVRYATVKIGQDSCFDKKIS
jgi:hypothetical protein